MDVKISGISKEIMRERLEQAREGMAKRLEYLASRDHPAADASPESGPPSLSPPEPRPSVAEIPSPEPAHADTVSDPARPLSVHIGTIVVRAHSPKPAQSRPQRPASGAQELREYLARRTSGGF
jgi:hypothetical protein